MPSGSAVADFNVCYYSLNALWDNLETIMTIQRPMHRIYAKIINAGFNQDSINRRLPAWWDEDLAETPAGAQYARLYLARIFSLAPESLKDELPLARFFSQIPSNQALGE